jgi:phage-related minor tail protein
MLVGELGPELILPSNSGTVVNAQRTAQMQQSGLQKSAASNAAPTIVNAPTSTVVDNKQSNTTISSTSFGHSNPALVAVNMAT